MTWPRIRNPLHWAGAIASVLAGVTLAMGVTGIVRTTGAQTVFIFFTAAVALLSWAYGAAAGTVAAVLSTGVARLAFMNLSDATATTRTADLATSLSFLLVGTLIAQITGALRRSRDRARALANEAAQARAATQHALELAEHASQVKDRFLASMSHELRTPLNAVVSYCDLLEDDVFGSLNDRQRRALQRTHAAAEHLTQLVNDVLDVARADSGGLSVRRDAIDVAAIARASAELVEPQARRKNLRLVTDRASSALAAIGDPKRCRQILVNLLANAVKFSPAGSEVRMSWGKARDTRRVFIRVVDSGIGIAEEHQERIFDAFAQITNDVTRNTVGSGLGLTISRRLARAMEGDIEVRSRMGDGAAFTLWLPATTPGTSVRDGATAST